MQGKTKTDTSLRGVPPIVWAMLIGIPSFFLTYYGIKMWVDMVQNPKPIAVTLAVFQRNPPKSGWYLIKGCEVNLTKAIYWEQNGVCSDAFAPISPNNAAGSAGANIYAEISDSSSLTLLQDMIYARSKDGGASKFISQHLDKFIQRRDVSGIVSYGRRDPMGELSKAGLQADATTFIEDGWQPNTFTAYGGSLGGGALTLFSLFLVVKQLRRP